MNSNRLCKPWEHEVSRRHWLGTAAASGAMALGGLGLNGLSAGGLGGLISEAAAAEFEGAAVALATGV